MTYSLYSISANALSQSGCSAYTYALNGFKPYTRAPWYQFSEQQVDNVTVNGGTNPAFPFMTGAGGWHQVGPMGWLGARLVEEQLIIQPALPPQIPYASIRTIIFGGAGIKATMNYTHTTITRVDVSGYLSGNSTYPYANTTMPFTVGFSVESGTNMTISLGQTLTIENRHYFDNTTTAGNLAQCLPVSSDDIFQPGQFPLAAVDGAASTRWQPTTRNPSSFNVDMRNIPYQPLTGVSFDWGRRPAERATVFFWNKTASSGSYSNSSDGAVDSRTVAISSISISSPYDADTNDVIQPYVGNMSEFAFSQPVWSGQYATLEIYGCRVEGDQLGATVAEFNIFGANGGGLFGGSGSSNGTANGTAGANATVSGVAVSTVTVSTTHGVVSSLATASIAGAAPSGSVVPEASNEGNGLRDQLGLGALVASVAAVLLLLL